MVNLCEVVQMKQHKPYIHLQEIQNNKLTIVDKLSTIVFYRIMMIYYFFVLWEELKFISMGDRHY